MGDPRKAKKSYTRPRSIWTSDQISSELYVVGSYGLRNKKELWKAQTEIARIRNQARSLLSLPIEVRQEKETKLLNYLSRFGLVTTSSTLDDILNLKIEDILERRLQTMVMKRSNLKSPYQARQIVVHGHVSIGNRKINLPGYLVKKDEELEILVHLTPVVEANNNKS
ncbi:MAG: 30S ribosomal protein S4 [Thermoproteota archaeon]|nr:30S ribosomal protein S4 [Thermoproteota archaeon]